MIEIKKSKLGQGLLEMIFAIGIMLIVVSAILGLTTANLVGQKESESQIIANNLAREGIEVVRNIRDSNWLAGANWDKGLTEFLNLQHEGITEFDSQNNTWTVAAPDSDLLYISPDGIYSHTPTAESEQSVFHRHLTFYNICQDQSGEEEIKSSDCNTRKIGLKIISEVSWSDRGRQRLVTLEDLLYDWK